MNTEKIIAVLALCTLATSLSGSVTDIFRDSRMFDQAYFSVSTNPEGNLSVKIAPHWAFRRTPGTKVLLFDFEHDSKSGQYSSAKVHRSVKVSQTDPLAMPASAEDYVITLEELPGLIPEIIDGL